MLSSSYTNSIVFFFPVDSYSRAWVCAMDYFCLSVIFFTSLWGHSSSFYRTSIQYAVVILNFSSVSKNAYSYPQLGNTFRFHNFTLLKTFILSYCSLRKTLIRPTVGPQESQISIFWFNREPSL